ncbi:MAG: hypothetical protein AAGA64_07085 [Bacteroidota bacterium]
MSEDWKAENTVSKWLDKNFQPFQESNISEQLKGTSFFKEGYQLTISELEEMVLQAAMLVQELGEDYLDVFERAERELEKVKQNMSTFDRIKNITKPHRTKGLLKRHFKSNFIEPDKLLLQAWTATIPRS